MPSLNTEEKVREVLDQIRSQIKAHDGYLEIGEVKDNKVVIYCGGECASCEEKCIEEALKEVTPDIEITFR